jgi:hypothetical protein
MVSVELCRFVIVHEGYQNGQYEFSYYTTSGVSRAKLSEQSKMLGISHVAAVRNTRDVAVLSFGRL